MAKRFESDYNDQMDLVSDTIIRALAYSDRYTKGTNLKAWLYTVMRNCQRDRDRWARARRLVAIHEVPEDKLPHNMAEKGGMESNENVDKMLETCPKPQQTVVRMQVFGGFSVDEIANSLNIPMGTVLSRLFRGKQAIREALCAAE